MNVAKCYFPSGATSAQTGLLITFPTQNEDGSRHLVITPAPLRSYFGVGSGNPLELAVGPQSNRFFRFELAANGPASASGGGTGGVYSHWIVFPDGSPT